MLIDFKMAYDKIKLELLFYSPLHFINVIMQCVTTTFFWFLWDGEKTNTFKARVSTLTVLVHLCLKRLSHLNLSKVVSNEWRGMRDGRMRLVLSHLFFASDLILHTKASWYRLNDA